jgi:Helicase HerA, central domain
MSLLLSYSIPEAIAIIRGDRPLAATAQSFPVEDLTVWRFTGIEPAVGVSVQDLDQLWSSVVRAWASRELTWGFAVTGQDAQTAWHILLPRLAENAAQSLKSVLRGARLSNCGAFNPSVLRWTSLNFRSAMAGHPGTGVTARLEDTVRAMGGRNISILVLAQPSPRSTIEEEFHRLNREDQVVRDEFLARPGLEQGNHTGATRYLELIEAARKRSQTALQEGGWQVRLMLAAETQSDLDELTSLVQSAYGEGGGVPEPIRWQPINRAGGLTFLGSTELAALTRPPRKDLPGFVVEGHATNHAASPIAQSAHFATTNPRRPDGKAICVGRILSDDGNPGEWLELGLNDLTRHLLVAGMTGSGKTTACEHLLLELWREHRIPWLVIEPGLNPSYRRLLNSEIGADLKVLAVATPNGAHLPLNPLAAPAGVGLAEHISGLFSVLISAFELVPPMPEVLASAIEETYRAHGWNPAGVVPAGTPPRLSALIETLDRHIRSLGYGPEITGNLRAGLLLRINRLARGPLARELASPQAPDLRSLLAAPCVIELSAVSDADSQALVLGLLSLQLRHHWRLCGAASQLRHVTLIEEAHRLLRAVPDSAAHAARARAVEDVANMLAELRGLGAGLIIVDQTPSVLVSSVIANTGTKILHRLDHPADRELAGRAAGLPSGDVDLLGAIRVGEAILRSDRRPRPFRVRLPNPAVTYGRLPIPELPSAEEPTCEVCGLLGCAASIAGSDPTQAPTRLRELQSTINRGEDALWAWALESINRSEANVGEPVSPLCFLVALARVAQLSDAAVQRLKTRLQSRTQRRTN